MDRSVLLVDDDPAVLDSVGRFLERSGYEVFRESSGPEAIERSRCNRPNMVLLDLKLPGVEGFELLEEFRHLDAAVVVLTGHGDVETAVSAMQRGAENFLTKPVEMPHLVAVLDRTHEKIRLKQQVLLKSRNASAVDIGALGVSRSMLELQRQIDLLADSDRTTVLLTGESGTGKGFVARMIHDLSARARAPFIDVNCGGLTATFLDSELFGHERGAFTDAKERKQGLFELADTGTIVLDEIGDLAPELQPKLLRVLESRSFRRIGGTREVSVDVRLIAATNKDLQAEVASGRFREDLYYRLSVIPLHLMPVRERSREDRLALIQQLLADLAPRCSGGYPDIDGSVLELLLSYPWPGNVREIRNVLERALILAEGGPEIGVKHLPGEIRRRPKRVESRHRPLTLRELERNHIERTLRANRGNRTHTARELGISRATLINKIKAYGLDG